MTTALLSELHFDLDHNSRSGLDEEAMSELVKSIEAIGLITPLTVRALPLGGYAVVDGHRRLEALNRLYGHEKETFHVPVLVRDVDDKDAVVLSLAANIVRLPLHPADQYKAFAKMLDEGLDKEAIAARFNLSGKDVERVLALGRVIPAALDLWRQGRIDADTVKLFASCSEERQLAVWKKAYEEDQLTRWQVHRLLSDDTLGWKSPIVQLVGEEAYEAAGGRIERSLFNDDVRWLDVELAMSLAHKAVTARVEELKTEGWAFVSHESDMPKQWKGWGREYADGIISEEAAARLEAIDKRLAEIEEIDIDELESEAEMELRDEVDQLEEEKAKIYDEAPQGFTPEQRAASGVVICEDFTIVMGVKKPAAVKLAEPGEKPAKEEGPKPWSQALVDEVESRGTVVAQLALMREHDLADRMLLATLYMDAVPTSTAKPFAFNSADRFADVQINAGAEIQKALKAFGLKGASFESLVEQLALFGQAKRDELRAVLMARIMKKRRGAELSWMLKTLETTDVIASWKPEKEFFERLNTKQLEAIYRELTGFGFKDPTTKASAVAMVATQAAARNWVPKALRNGLKTLDQVKLDNNLETAKKKGKAKAGPKPVTVVGEDGKTAKRKKAA